MRVKVKTKKDSRHGNTDSFGFTHKKNLKTIMIVTVTSMRRVTVKASSHLYRNFNNCSELRAIQNKTHTISNKRLMFVSNSTSIIVTTIFFLLNSNNSIAVAAMSTMSSSSSNLNSNTKNNINRILDSHLHVWANENESTLYPYAIGQEPPETIKNLASYETLVNDYIIPNNINGALIVQPINHKFDHTYVTAAIQKYPTVLKGMLLFDPSLSIQDAISSLENLSLHGYVGVRFNPYLWPKSKNVESESTSSTTWELMSTIGSSGLEVYKRCGELQMPVGIMCFQGISLHYNDIIQLLQISPKTNMILDHFAFTSLSNVDDQQGGDSDSPITTITKEDEQFQQLLSLAKYTNVYIKISALFRLNDKSPYTTVYTKRFIPLLEAFGSHRLLYGSDFPFVMNEPEKYDMYKLVSSWTSNDIDQYNIMSGTAEKLFGPWGVPIVPPTTMTTTTKSSTST